MIDVINIASDEIGNAGDKAQKYNDWYYKKPGIKAAWCGTFVSWCFNQAGQPLGVIDNLQGYCSVPNAAKHYSGAGLMTKTPIRNCICFFNWQGNTSNLAALEHTGIFEKDNGDGKTFTSIEGNTSGQGGDQSNGGVVFRKIRYYSTAIFAQPFK